MQCPWRSSLAVLRFVERYIDDLPTLINTFLRKLETMTTCTDEPLLKVVVEMGRIQICVKVSEESERVASNDCGLLYNFCGYSLEYNNKRVVKCGGILWHWKTRSSGLKISKFKSMHRQHSIDWQVTLYYTHPNDVRVRIPTNHALVELVQQKPKLLNQ
mmetsp:Transcript_22882/g.41566  ORF Transcript_22882/g.41566 Transcript_22882/m.41566 type:complete len:159 (+) Transcript_22882:236-712(+)